MKIWVEDLPIGCCYCDCKHTKEYDCRTHIDGEKFCGIENMELYDYCNYENPKRPDWCPLRELPKKLITKYSNAGNMFRNGWNACLDEIIGGEDEVRN